MVCMCLKCVLSLCYRNAPANVPLSTAAQQSRPQIPFMGSSSQPRADTHQRLSHDSTGQIPGSEPSGSTSEQPGHVDQQDVAPAKQRPPSRPQSSSSQHQLHDLGFEDVDLDSPDAAISKSRSDHAIPPVRSHIMPIPFMQPVAQDTSPSSAMAAADFTASVTQPPAEHDAGSLHLAADHPNPAAAHAFATAVHATPADSSPFQADGHVIIDQHEHDGTVHPAVSTERFEEMPSGVRAGPFSTYSGPPSTSSSTPASPGSGHAPVRRPSFLPRGMSTHLQKALRATAAAASKASAAIAPLPNSTNSASSLGAWKVEAGGTSPQSLPTQGAGSDHAFPFEPQWGQSGPASTFSVGEQDRVQEGKPWWQQQLRNLQHNLQSPQQLQPDAASDSDADIAAAEADTFFSQPGGQAAWIDNMNGNAPHPEMSAQEPDMHSRQQQQEQQQAGAYQSPQHVSSEHEQAAAKGQEQYQHQGDTDSIPIMHHLPCEESASVFNADEDANQTDVTQDANQFHAAAEFSAVPGLQTGEQQEATSWIAQVCLAAASAATIRTMLNRVLNSP